MDLAASVGLYLDDWQCWVLDRALAERGDGKWCATLVALLVARQNGKNAILEALELAALFLWDEMLVVHSAHKFDTAQEHFARIRGLIEESADLSRRVRTVYTANGKEAIILRSGARLKFIARQRGGARGFTGDRLVLDEAFDLNPSEIGAMLPALSARSMRSDSNPQVWFTSSAPQADSAVLHDLRKKGTDDSTGRLFFAEWSAPFGTDVRDRDGWAQANPGLGVRISEEWIEETELSIMTDEQFARERLGIVPQDDPDADAMARWVTLFDLVSKPVSGHRIAVDVAPDGVASSIAGAGIRSDGLEHVEVAYHQPGTEWVVPKLVEIRADRPETVVVLDPGGPAGVLVADLEAANIPLRKVTTREAAQAAGGLVEATKAGLVRHRAQAALNAAVAGARRRDIGDGGWAWSRKSSTVDISPLVAVTLARWALTAVEPPKPAFTPRRIR